MDTLSKWNFKLAFRTPIETEIFKFEFIDFLKINYNFVDFLEKDKNSAENL